MPMTEKKRISDANWKKKNLTTVGCTLYKQDADDFRRYAEERGESVRSLLRGYVASCLGRPLERRDGGKSEATGPEGV